MSALAAESLWRLAPMHPEHLPYVVDIERRSYEFPWSEGVFRDCLRVGYSAWVVTDTLGAVLGYALMSMAVDEAHLLNLCVDPDLRRRGLARLLLEHCIALARGAGMAVILLEVRRSNIAALELYKGYGFKRLAVRKAYYPAREGREDAHLLCYAVNN